VFHVHLEAWSLALREERRLRVFENRVLWGIFGPKRDEVIGEWRKLHNEELNDLYCSPNIVFVLSLTRDDFHCRCNIPCQLSASFDSRQINQFQPCAVAGTDSVTPLRHAQSLVLTL